MRYRGWMILPIMFVFLTGCWDNKDINKRVLPVAMGICEGENQTYKVGLRIPQPNGGKITIRHIEAEARTISEAIDKMRMEMENSIDLLHLKLILISESMAKESIQEIMEYTMQSREIPSKVFVALVRGHMIELLKSQQKGGEEGGAGFYDFFSKEAGWTPHVSRVFLWEGFRSMYSHTEDVALPILSKGTPETMFQYQGSAIMRRDKMVGIITPDETLMYNIYKNNYDEAHLEIMEHASVMVLDAEVFLNSSWYRNAPKINSSLKVIVTIEEMKEGATLTVIEKELKQLLQERFQKLMNKLQTQHSDLMGFGQQFRNQMSQSDTKEWREMIYPKLKVEQSVDVVIRNSGSLKAK
ncbi:MAG: Ger(x)C family spore germination protein [Bacillota bacterium]